MKSTQFKQTAMMVAVMGLFAVPFAAQAMTVVPAGSQTVPSNIFPAATSTISNQYDIPVGAAATDTFLGRTTGFNLIVTLHNAKFAAGSSAPSTLSALSGLSNGGTVASAASGLWAVSKAGGGAEGDSSVTYSVQPGTLPLGIIQGGLVNFAPGTLTFDNTTLGTVGGSVTIDISFNDPVTGAQLTAVNGAALISSVDGVAYTAPTGSSTTKIDVGASSTMASKSHFSLSGSIGAWDSAIFTAGTFSFAPTTASCTGTNVATATNCSSGAWMFASGADAVSVTVNATDLSAFRQTGASIYLVASTSACSGGVPITGTSGASTGSISSMTLPAATLVATGGSYTVCLAVPNANTMAIAPQALTMSAALTFANTAITNPSAKTGTLFPLAYNGTVREVYFFNPASNAVQVSSLRVVNPSNTAGKVTVNGVKDNAVAGTGAVTFTLLAGEAKTISGSILENGDTVPATAGTIGSLGVGTAGKKWHLTVTGEFPSMQVQSFVNANGILTNMSSTVMGTTIQNGN